MQNRRYPAPVDEVPDLRPASRAWSWVVVRAKELVIITTALGVFGLSLAGVGAATLKWMGIARSADFQPINTQLADMNRRLGTIEASLKKLTEEPAVSKPTPPPAKPAARRRRAGSTGDGE